MSLLRMRFVDKTRNDDHTTCLLQQSRQWLESQLHTYFICNLQPDLASTLTIELVIDLCNIRKGYDSLNFPWFFFRAYNL